MAVYKVDVISNNDVMNGADGWRGLGWMWYV